MYFKRIIIKCTHSCEVYFVNETFCCIHNIIYIFYVKLYYIFYVKLYYILYVMLYYILYVMLYYILYVMLYYILYVELCVIQKYVQIKPCKDFIFSLDVL